MRYEIIENDHEMGYITDDPVFDYAYRGGSRVAESTLADIKESATDMDTGYGPGGSPEERAVEAGPSTKLRRAADMLSNRPGIEVRPADG